LCLSGEKNQRQSAKSVSKKLRDFSCPSWFKNPFNPCQSVVRILRVSSCLRGKKSVESACPEQLVVSEPVLSSVEVVEPAQRVEGWLKKFLSVLR
jgi:hypothetical protein